jgi:hypothetical protein
MLDAPTIQDAPAAPIAFERVGLFYLPCERFQILMLRTVFMILRSAALSRADNFGLCLRTTFFLTRFFAM